MEDRKPDVAEELAVLASRVDVLEQERVEALKALVGIRSEVSAIAAALKNVVALVEGPSREKKEGGP